jgi:hypothetical protein
LSAGIQSAVNYFADQMSLIYPDEELRKNDGLLALNCIFSLRTDSHCIQLTEPATEVSPYGHIFRVGPHKAASCIAVFKNELADDTPIPYVEMTSHFTHTTREATLDSVSRSVMRRWNFPCLGITIVGMSYVCLHFMPADHHARPLCHILCHDLFRSMAGCRPHARTIVHSSFR